MAKNTWNTDDDRVWIDKLIEHAAREADICLSCPLKRCRPQDCRRFKEEAKKRGIFDGRLKALR